MTASLEFHPVTADRWDDFERLFGPRGAFGGCWCMFNRLKASEFEAGQGDGNRAAMRDLVDSGRIPGILAYRNGTPVGWCSVAPREQYGRIQRSPVTKPVDDVPVWSITCFYIHRDHRGSGVGTALLDAAVDFAAAQGATAVEGYPVVPKKDRVPEIYLWQGLASMFDRGGFEVIARRKPARPIYRKRVASHES